MMRHRNVHERRGEPVRKLDHKCRLPLQLVNFSE